jgi:hypothetical protein
VTAVRLGALRDQNGAFGFGVSIVAQSPAAHAVARGPWRDRRAPRGAQIYDDATPR